MCIRDRLYRTDGTAAPEVLTAFASAAEPVVRMGAALAGGAVVFTNNGIGQGTVHFVGTPGVRVIRQQLTGTGAVAQTLSDGAGGSLGVAFDVQAIAGSGEMRLQLLDHTAEPLAGDAPAAGVLLRYVRIERPSSISAIDTDLTFTYTDTDLAQAGANEATLVVWKYTGGVWTKLPVAARDLDANTLTVAGITSFSDFVIADDAAVLPVELVSFTGVADGATARLAWTTASETNNTGFGVEHLQGSAWVERGFVAGRGTTTERTDYRFDVTGLTAGRHAFRLVQRDLDGTAHVSQTLTVEIQVGTGADGAMRTGLRLTPLATHGVRVEANDEATLDLVDLLGRSVMTRRLGPGTTDVRFDGVAAGVYVVRVRDRQASETQRVIVR